MIFDPKKVWGGIVLAQLKKIIISIPDNLLKEIDLLVEMENKNRSEFVQEAMKLYLRKKQKIRIRERMKKGYIEMTNINIEFSREFLEVDNEQLQKYEERLRQMT